MRILGVDPGTTTGFCMVNSDKPRRPIGAEQQGGKALKMLLLWAKEADVVVVEGVVAHGSITKGKVDQLKMVGAVELVCNYLGLPLEIVSPEERGRIKKVPLGSEVVGKHALDAYKAAIAYMIKDRGLVPEDVANDFLTARKGRES